MKIKYRKLDGTIIAWGAFKEDFVGDVNYGVEDIDQPVPSQRVDFYKRTGANTIVEKSAPEKAQVLIDADPDKEDFKSSVFAGVTPARAETWIDNNVTDLASAKNALKKIVKVLLYLVRRSSL